MRNLSTTTTAAQHSPATQTDEQQRERVHVLIRRAFMLAGDESVARLSWSDRDQIARDLHEATAILHKLHPQEERAH